jgi:hypothetical protein
MLRTGRGKQIAGIPSFILKCTFRLGIKWFLKRLANTKMVIPFHSEKEF